MDNGHGCTVTWQKRQSLDHEKHESHKRKECSTSPQVSQSRTCKQNQQNIVHSTFVKEK
jgi:hypothetical protein